MKIVSVAEDTHIEKRVAITPETTKKYLSEGFEVLISKNYGDHLGFSDNEYKELGMCACIGVDMKQPIKNYILISDLQKTSTCWTSYKGKYNMQNDWLNLLEIVDYDHKYFGSKSDFHSHMDTCIYVDSLWLFKE